MNIEPVYSGYILYHNTDDSFANGWKYEHGQITHIINEQETGEVFSQLKSGHLECQTHNSTVIVTECVDWYSYGEFDGYTSPASYGGTSCHTYKISNTRQECYWVEDPYYVPNYPMGGYIPPTTTTTEPVNPLTTATTPCDVINTYPLDGWVSLESEYAATGFVKILGKEGIKLYQDKNSDCSDWGERVIDVQGTVTYSNCQ